MRFLTIVLLVLFQMKTSIAWAGPKKAPLKLPEIGSQPCNKQSLFPRAASAAAASVSEAMDHAFPEGYDTISRLADIEAYAQPGDWVFFGLDGVLINTRAKRVSENGEFQLQTQLLSPDTIDVLDRLRNKGVKLLGLTARPLSDATSDQAAPTTFDNLASVGIYMDSVALSQSALKKGNKKYKYFYQRRGTLDSNGYCLGTLFVNGGDKGEGLNYFFGKLRENGMSRPKRVLFIDNVKENVQSVKRSSMDGPTDTLCFHFVPGSSSAEAPARRVSLPIQSDQPVPALLVNIKKKNRRRSESNVQLPSLVQLPPLK